MRTLAIFIVTLLGLSASAQEYKSIIKEGRTWVMAMISDDITNLTEWTVVANVCGDTLVDGRTCKKINVRKYPDDMKTKAREFSKAVYEEDGKVYLYDYLYEGENKFSLLIDMNLCKGDVIHPIHEGSNFEATSVDVADIRGEQRRRIVFEDCQYRGNPLAWVEGIGSTIDFYATPKDRISNWCATFILECYDNGKLVYTKDDLLKTPLPTDVSSVIGSTYNKITGSYDLSGKRIGTPHKGEIYIKNGEKHIGE